MKSVKQESSIASSQKSDSAFTRSKTSRSSDFFLEPYIRKSVIPQFPYPLSLYQIPPLEGNISILNFEQCATKRFALLQFIEELCGVDYSVYAVKNEDILKKIDAKCDELNFKFKKNSISEEKIEIARLDAISHFILRLSFAGQRDKEDWLIKQESRLFLFKIYNLNSSFCSTSSFSNFQKKNSAFHSLPNLYAEEAMKVQMQNTFNQNKSNNFCRQSENDLQSAGKTPFEIFMQKENFNYPIFEMPADNSSAECKVWKSATNFRSLQTKVLYMVSFYPDAINLVRSRKVFIKNMIAYIPPEDMDVVILAKFKNVMIGSFKLLRMKEFIWQERISNDERIASFMKVLPSMYINPKENSSVLENEDYRLTPNNIHHLWKTSFPPCMKNIYLKYMKERHIRHWSRQQFWMFLKGAGMSMDEQLQFNRSVWNEPNKFDKEHRYQIRHMYGQEGKRANYSAYNCSKILGAVLPSPGVGEHHGCPFKHFDSTVLKKMLFDFGVASKGVQAILELKKTNQFQLACVEYFVQTHPGSAGNGVGNHPNAFFNESRKFLSNLPRKSNISEDDKKNALKTE